MKIDFTSPQHIGCASPLTKILILLFIGIFTYLALTSFPLDIFQLSFTIGVSLTLLFFISPWYLPSIRRLPLLPVILLATFGIVSILYRIIHQTSNYQDVVLFSISTCFNLLIISPWYRRIKRQGRTFIAFLLVIYTLIAILLLFQQHLVSSTLKWFIVLFMTSFIITWYVYIQKTTYEDSITRNKRET